MKEIELRGENKRFFESDSSHKLLVGDRLVGKTYTACHLINRICSEVPNTRVLICRKSLSALRYATIPVLKDVIMNTGMGDDIRVLGESRPTNFIYSNNSEISLGAIDSRGKWLAGEWSVIYVAGLYEGLALDEFRLVTSRARLNNRLVIAEDCLPSDFYNQKNHWLYQLPDMGFEVFNPTYKDNPRFYKTPEKPVKTEKVIWI